MGMFSQRGATVHQTPCTTLTVTEGATGGGGEGAGGVDRRALIAGGALIAGAYAWSRQNR